MQDKIPLTVIVVTKNEEKNLTRCLASLERFDEVIVVDSQSTDTTADIARSFGVLVMPFVWSGAYPKKRQWCLDHLRLKHDRVFFVDADEEIPPGLCNEIAALDWSCAGYFVQGVYVVHGRALRFGLKNDKLCLFDRHKIHFPVVDDLDIPGMGEIEGHYQPVLKDGVTEPLGALRNSMLHYAMEDPARHEGRHLEYARWKAGMDARRAYPSDPVKWRQQGKSLFSAMPGKSLMFFAYYYFVKLGILEYPHNVEIFRQKLRYYKGGKSDDHADEHRLQSS